MTREDIIEQVLNSFDQRRTLLPDHREVLRSYQYSELRLNAHNTHQRNMDAVRGRFIYNAPSETIGHCLDLLIHPPDTSELGKRVPSAALLYWDPYSPSGDPDWQLDVEDDISVRFIVWFYECSVLRYAETTDLIYKAFADNEENWAPILVYVADEGRAEYLPWLGKLLEVAGGIDSLTLDQKVLFDRAKDVIALRMARPCLSRWKKDFQRLRRLIGEE